MLRKKSADNLAWTAVMFLAVVPVALGQTGVVGTSVLAHSVADAMTSAGAGVNPDQIEFLAGARNTGESARMRVVSVTTRTNGSLKVKLRCEDNHECLPFYVLVHGVPVHGLDRVNLVVSKRGAEPLAAVSAPPNLMRGGDHATLILESEDSRLSVPVICLQSGAQGQTIKVTSPDHRQVYEAQVVAVGMLKGTL